jgi:hypothetical protein
MLNWIFNHVIQAENVNSTTRLVNSSANISIINFYKSFGFYMYYITSSQLHHIKCLNCIIITGLYLSSKRPKRKIKWKVMHTITQYRKMVLHWAECFYRKILIILELVQNQNHVSEWNEMLPYKNPTKCVGLVQSGHHHHLIKCNTCIGGVLLSILDSSAVDHGFKPNSNRTRL